MISPEHEQYGAIGFLEAIERLAKHDGLVLTKRYMRVIHEGRVTRELPVHYEGLDTISGERHILDGAGTLVTNEFQIAAKRTLDTQGARPRSTYPLMTIVDDDESELRYTEVMDVAELIDRGDLPIYAHASEHTKSGEVLSLGMGSVIRRMASMIGMDPSKVVIIDGIGVRSADEVIHVHESYSPVQPDQFSDIDIDRRGETMLAILQIALSRVFTARLNRTTNGIYGHLEVVFRATSRPDMQTMILSLIEIAESLQVNLYCSKGLTLIDDEGIQFTFVDDSFSLRFGLATEKTAQTAVYSAYMAALDIFKRY